MTGRIEGGSFIYTTLDGAEVTAPLNLNREQWETYEATPDNLGPKDAWAFFEALGVEGVADLGVLDIQRLSNEWGAALGEALGLTPGESDGSTEPSTAPTGGRSRSTSAGSSKSRSRMSAA